MTGETITDSPATYAGTTDAATLAARSEGWRDRYTAAMMLTFAPPRAMLGTIITSSPRSAFTEIFEPCGGAKFIR